MAEQQITYDDDSADTADTAAQTWAKTRVGHRLVGRHAPEDVIRAFRTGYLVGQKAAEAGKGE